MRPQFGSHGLPEERKEQLVRAREREAFAARAEVRAPHDVGRGTVLPDEIEIRRGEIAAMAEISRDAHGLQEDFG